MDIATTRKMLADAEALVTRLKDEIAKDGMPVEPPFIQGTPVIITFVKRFSWQSGKFYNYAAIGLRSNVWYLTGRRVADPEVGMTWRRLTEFMVTDESEYTRKMVVESVAVWSKDDPTDANRLAF